MSRNIKKLSFLVIALSSIALSGCGTSGGGSGPVSQPIAQPSSVGSSSQPASNSAKTTTSKTTSKTTVTNKTKKSNTATTSSVTTTTSLALSPVTVSETGTGSSFVPVSSTISSILLPAGWQMQTMSLGSGGTSIKLTNPTDSAQMISEVIMPSDRNLQSFYNAQSTGTVHWIVPNQILSYTQSNPNNPYQDRGIEANLSSGGSVRVDVYLPSSEQSSATKILNSFIGSSAN